MTGPLARFGAWLRDVFALDPGPAGPRYSDVHASTANPDTTTLDFAITQAESNYAEVNASRETIESKASNLLGFTGVLAGFAAGGVALAGDGAATTNEVVTELLAAVFGLSLLIMAIAAVQLGRTIGVTRKNAWMIVDGRTALDVLGESEIERRRNVLASLVTAAQTNTGVNMGKASRLRSAQVFLILALALLVLAGITAAIGIVLQ